MLWETRLEEEGFLYEMPWYEIMVCYEYNVFWKYKASAI